MPKKTTRRSASVDSFAGIEPASGFQNLPKGSYEGYIKPGSAVVEPKDGGGHRTSLTLIVDDGGKQNGNAQTYRQDLTSDFGKALFLQVLEILELGRPADVNEAAKLLEDTDNIRVRFYVAEPKDENPPKVYINEKLEGEGSGEAEEEEEEETSGEDEEYTREEIMEMSEDELVEFNTEAELGLDDADYDTWEEYAKALADEYGV